MFNQHYFSKWIILVVILFSFQRAISQSKAYEYTVIAQQIKKTQPDSAVNLYINAAKLYFNEDSLYASINSWNQAAIILTRQDRYMMALIILNEATDAAFRMNDTLSLETATTHIAYGVVYNAQEDYALSLKHHFKSLNIRLPKLGYFHSDIATNYGNIGNVFFNDQQYDSAIFYHNKAFEIRDSLFESTSNEITQSYTGLGNAYRELQNYEKSIFYFDAALKNKIIQLGPNDANLIPFYNRLIEVYKLSKDKASAKINQQRVKEIEKLNS